MFHLSNLGPGGPAVIATSKPAAVLISEDRVSTREVAVAEKGQPGRRSIYSMQAVRSRHQAAALLARMESYEDLNVLMTQNTQEGASSFDSREGEQMQEVDGMLGIDHVNGGEFGSRSTMKGGAVDLKRSARGEEDENGMDRSSEGEHRGLEVKKKIRGVAVLLGLARQL